MKTSVVILNWNGRDFLKKYLPCLLDSLQGYDEVETVVADNASTDGSRQLLAEEFPQVRLIQLSKNYGFAQGYNLALRKLDSELFILLNSDVEVSPGWISPLLDWMEYHPECGICAPLLHRTDQRDSFEYAGAAGGYLDRWCYPFCRGRVMDMLEKDEGQYSIPQEMLWVSGAALVVRSEVFKALKGFCGDFFAHMEEIDLCWRARIAGWRVNIVPRSVVYHVGGGSLSPDSPFKLFLNYRNNLLMMRRCLPYTYAVHKLYSLLGALTMPDEGPDLIHNCDYIFNVECDQFMRKQLVELAAETASVKTESTIFVRMVLDGLSALVYLLSFRPKAFKAVIKAHREYRKISHKVEIVKIKQYLNRMMKDRGTEIPRVLLSQECDNDNAGDDKFRLKGMWSKWIVAQRLIHNGDMFDNIKERIV